MDRNMDFNNFSNSSNFNPYDNGFDSQPFETPMITPVMQYEQAYMYYKYLSQQMDYRIKCKEFEKLNNSKNRLIIYNKCFLYNLQHMRICFD